MKNSLTHLKIATRKSPLALWQANHVKAQIQHYFPALEVSLVTFVTQGDKILDVPLAKVGGKGLFVKELEQALLSGEADIAVHSTKDLPMQLPEGLAVPVFMKREDPTDAFVSNTYGSVDDLPKGAVIGTSSLRRQTQLQAYRPDLLIKSVRGNVGTRLAKLDSGEYDAIILATSGLKRLGLHERIKSALNIETSLPAVGQGVLGIECRTQDDAVLAIIQKLACTQTMQCVLAERAMNRRLEGGCQVPIAGHATIDDGVLTLKGLVANADGSKVLTAIKTLSFSESSEQAKLADRTELVARTSQDFEPCENLGIQVAEELLAQGAGDILAGFYE